MLLIIVSTAVKFNDQFGGRGIKIDNIVVNRLLPAKFDGICP